MSMPLEDKFTEPGDFPPPDEIVGSQHLCDIWSDLVGRRPKVQWSKLDLNLLKRAMKYLYELEQLDIRIEEDGYETLTPQGAQVSIDFRARGRIETQLNVLLARLGLTYAQMHGRLKTSNEKMSEQKENQAQAMRNQMTGESDGLLARRGTMQ